MKKVISLSAAVFSAMILLTACGPTADGNQRL